MASKPMLGGIELEQVAWVGSEQEESLAEHEVPALEGDFLQRLGRRGAGLGLQGTLVGPAARDAVETLRKSFRAAAPVSFVTDIATSTRVDQVLIEDLAVRELAGKPERFDYLLRLREYTPPPKKQPPPLQPPPPTPAFDTGTLVTEVTVEGQSSFDFSTVDLSLAGTADDGSDVSRSLTNRTEGTWTDDAMPPGTYTVTAVVPAQSLSGSVSATIRTGETTRVSIILKPGTVVAKAFIVHFWFDRAFVEPCMRAVLRDVASYATAHPDERLVIVGHTDLAGSAQYNQSLSERRARAVYAYLTVGGDRARALDEWKALRHKASGALPSVADSWGVREYQWILQDLGYYSGAIDEQHGPATDQGVRAFQQDLGLAVDGIVGDATWDALVAAYLDQDRLAVPASQFLPNCDGEVLKWLGCGEQDPVKNTRDAWRPNRRTELAFVKAAILPCPVPRPDTFDLPAAGGKWCLGPGSPTARCCFIARGTAQPGRWLLQPVDPKQVVIKGVIKSEDGSPLADANYVLTAPDGEYMDGEHASGPDRGRPIPGRTTGDGSFTYPSKPKGTGIYTLEVVGSFLVRSADDAPDSQKGNVVCLRLSATAVRDAPAAGAGLPAAVVLPPGAPKPVVNPIIELTGAIVVVRKPHTAPARVRATLRTSAAFDRTGTLKRSKDGIHFFTAAVGGKEITFDGTDNVFPGAALTTGVQLFAEGIKASDAVGDVTLTLTLAAGGAPAAGPPIVATMTAVELTVDVCMSRTADATDPGPLPQPPPAPPGPGATDKWYGGRLVHIQDPGNHHGRALLIVRQVRPTDFTGDLVLRQVTVAGNTVGALGHNVEVFDNEFRPVAGEAAKANPLEFSATTVPASGLQFWVEGHNVSGSLRDTGFQLGVKGGESDGDRVSMTVMRFTNLRATIPATPARTPRLGNSPVPPHVLRIATGAAPIAADFSVDFGVNAPLVLLEASLAAANPVALDVTVTPAGIPVSWTVERDTRPAPDGDDPGVVALSPNATPTLTPGAPLRATLLPDSVGSFHLRPYVDCNGNGKFDATRNAEPFIVMNLVLVRVTLHADAAVARSTNFVVGPGGGVGSIGVSSGSFTIGAPATAAIHMNAQADAVGGGGDGTRGLDRVFAGWINTESANENILARFSDTTVAPPVQHQSLSVFASNRASATGAGPTFVLGDPAPALVAPPLLDSGRAPAGAGGDTACLTTSRIRSRTRLRSPAAPAAVGQRLVVEAVDSPGDGEGATDLGFPAAQLVRFRFGLTFGAFLCCWTNRSAAAGGTGAPADRLYSALLRLDWSLIGEWTVNPATGAIAVVTAPKASITARTPSSPAVAAATTPAEVRPPTGLSLLARDARA